jgi:hypothetical protein
VRSLDGTEKSHQHVSHAIEQRWQLFQHLAATQFLGIVDDHFDA